MKCDNPLELLQLAGWKDSRNRKHNIWKCPCGKHHVVVSLSCSDWRGYKNLLADIKRLGCKSISDLLEKDEEDKIVLPKELDGKELVCFICKKSLLIGEYGKSWAFHDDMMCHLSHHGMKEWHRLGCKKERKVGKI